MTKPVSQSYLLKDRVMPMVQYIHACDQPYYFLTKLDIINCRISEDVKDRLIRTVSLDDSVPLEHSR